MVSPGVKRGLLILCEGIDHCGKSTQAELLKASLSNSSVIHFPHKDHLTSTLLNPVIDKTIARLEPHALAMIFSANRWQKAADIRNRIESGETVILDRYVYSGWAYARANYSLAFAKTGTNPVGEPNLEWLEVLDSGLPVPDIVLQFDVDPLIAMSRFLPNETPQIYENVQFLTEVNKWFDYFEKNLTKEINWVKIAANNRSKEDIHNEVDKIVTALGCRSSGPLRSYSKSTLSFFWI